MIDAAIMHALTAAHAVVECAFYASVSALALFFALYALWCHAGQPSLSNRPPRAPRRRLPAMTQAERRALIHAAQAKLQPRAATYVLKRTP